jgi:type IX secretion system PorP/SprF family membrane protein
MKKQVMTNISFNSIKLSGIVLLMSFSVNLFAQQDPTFTQYNFNTQTINPAYAGTWNNLGFLVLGRHQWAGMEGAPTTYTFSMQAPTKFTNVAVGLNIISDRIGFEKRLLVNGDYSYRLLITEDIFLRLGIKGGITSYSNNLTDYIGYPGDPADPMFISDIDVKLMPNFGIGTFLSGDDFYLGLSLPKMLQNDFDNNYNNISVQAATRHLFFIGGYAFDVSNDVKFKPSFLMRKTWNAPSILDLTASFLLREQIWLGANYRLRDSFGFIAQWIFDNQLRIGYAVDFTTSRLHSLHSGTHEVMVSYELGAVRKWSSPRMF